MPIYKIHALKIHSKMGLLKEIDKMKVKKTNNLRDSWTNNHKWIIQQMKMIKEKRASFFKKDLERKLGHRLKKEIEF